MKMSWGEDKGIRIIKKERESICTNSTGLFSKELSTYNKEEDK